MKAYLLSGYGGMSITVGTMAEARERVSQFAGNHGPWQFVRVDEQDIPTDKDSIITLINCGAGGLPIAKSRRWRLTSRGGLREMTPQEIAEEDEEEAEQQ